MKTLCVYVLIYSLKFWEVITNSHWNKHSAESQVLFQVLYHISVNNALKIGECFKCLKQYPHFVKYLINASYEFSHSVIISVL